MSSSYSGYIGAEDFWLTVKNSKAFKAIPESLLRSIFLICYLVKIIVGSSAWMKRPFWLSTMILLSSLKHFSREITPIVKDPWLWSISLKASIYLNIIGWESTDRIIGLINSMIPLIFPLLLIDDSDCL